MKRSVRRNGEVRVNTKPPPPVLADARVLAFADIDDSIEFTGKLRLYAGDSLVGRVPRLAICETTDERELVVCHCDEEWNVIGVQAWNGPAGPSPRSIEDVKRIMEKYYRGSSGSWRTVP